VQRLLPLRGASISVLGHEHEGGSGPARAACAIDAVGVAGVAWVARAARPAGPVRVDGAVWGP
jgi:hypothetical protein